MSTDNTPAPQVEIQLPELPEPQKECWIGHDLYSAAQMRAYAQAALNARAGRDDSVRLDWLESGFYGVMPVIGDGWETRGECVHHRAATVRAAIDAALASQAVGVKDGR